MRVVLNVIAVVAALIAVVPCAQSQSTPDDPLRHGHALLIGISKYKHGWADLVDVPLQLDALQKGLSKHFDTVEKVEDLETEQLRQKINAFVRSYGNDSNARLFIYYAGHGYTEVIAQFNENRGYITGTDTPPIDGTAGSYTAARLRAISMAEIRALLQETLARHVLFLFDSCFAGTIFTTRGTNDPPPVLTQDTVARLMTKPARDFITAGKANERVPAHSPIPAFFLAAINGAADRYNHGVISASDIHAFLRDRVLRLPQVNLTPQGGRLPDPSFAEGEFLFRITPALPRILEAAPKPGTLEGAPNPGDQPKLIFSSWSKSCLLDREANGKQTCTSKEGRVESGMKVVGAELVQRYGKRAILRITLPLGMSLQPGTRAIIDNGQPLTAPYTDCFSDGCVAEYEVTDELVAKLKTGHGLALQGINGSGQPISLVLPLADFAKAHDGPPMPQMTAESKRGQPASSLSERQQLIFSPWTKFCLKGQEANAKQVCFTAKDGRVESGMPVVAAVLIEPENEPKKVLRVTLPLGTSLRPGARVIVDNGQPMTEPYVICFNNGCMADYEASGELIGRLKKGQGLVIQGIKGAGQPISLVVPLTDFAKAYDGPPTDPKKFEEQQKQLQEDLQRRAQETTRGRAR
jgi:invasion protein IalB